MTAQTSIFLLWLSVLGTNAQVIIDPYRFESAAASSSCDVVGFEFTNYNSNNIAYLHSTSDRIYQGFSFSVSNSATACAIQFLLKYGQGSPTATLKFQLWSDNSDKPGSLLSESTATLDTSTVTNTTPQYYELPITLLSVTTNTQYWIVSKASAYSATDGLAVFYNSTTNSDIMRSENTTNWTSSANLCFNARLITQ